MSTSLLHSHRVLASAAAALLIAGLGAGPAAARPDAGAPAASASVAGDHECPLERVGQQLVKCDDLTGNGVPAPGWIPEQ